MKHIFLFISILFIVACKTNKENKLNSPSTAIKQKTNKLKGLIKSVKRKKLTEFCSEDLVLNQKTINRINNYINFSLDSLKVLDFKEEKLLYTTSINIVNADTKNYQPSYYYFLLENKDDDVNEIYFSENYLYKKVQSSFYNIDLLILFNKIIQKSNTDELNTIGYNMDILTYDNVKEKLIDRKRLITSGIGLEDVSYHECFVLSSEKITSYSYNSLEDESTFVKREMMIRKDGIIIIRKPTIKVFD
ncbi:hypothetical protein TM902_380002 [Tenacibaculum maritimum]|uniref:hypothetical protein n=1 Tax=Tenacibaculum maritimum TaxID=107401 RepID=UPI0012E4184D|nr:hypothetical protein [Tenacibaculum maritimum]MDB0601572.1 hypothetical protein [Tenacibaculum maritimum]MDB0602872.1 hypothetical protein [Tenacibaculum maritimum]MDB0612879.1 hypothetical protein [Tenacibaculum maritimum]CAA0158867.1 hypothetical protein TM902_380002 [Tenacibaculum maritimum]CAA0214527.1 hypothetical protein TMP445_530002 [Tenacibaculum maritimum]